MDKDSMLRWVNIKGQICPDWTQKASGRSVYTHFKKECIEGIFIQKKLPSKFADNFTGYSPDRENIGKYIIDQARRSLNHFISLSIKSGKLVKGQNLVTGSAKKGKIFKYCLLASDLSENTASEVQKALSIPVRKIKLDKSELGLMIDGRPCGVIAFFESELSEKVCFYLDLVENFISGDINAHQ